MISLNWNAIEKASEHHLQIAHYMQDAQCHPEDIVHALEVFDKRAFVDHPEVREAMLIDQWAECQRQDWDGEQESKDTEYQQHLRLSAD